MQARAEKTRQKIFQSALNLFSQKGFSGTSVDLISEKAGVNKQRIYAYFGSKEKLFEAVLAHCFEATLELEKEFLHLKEKDLPRLTETLLRRYLVFHREHPHFWRILSWENLEGGKHSRTIEGLRQKNTGHLSALYRRGQALGHFHPRVDFITYVFALSALSFFFHSNQKTFSQSFNFDLLVPKNREKIFRESVKLMNSFGGRKGVGKPTLK